MLPVLKIEIKETNYGEKVTRNWFLRIITFSCLKDRIKLNETEITESTEDGRGMTFQYDN